MVWEFPILGNSLTMCIYIYAYVLCYIYILSIYIYVFCIMYIYIYTYVYIYIYMYIRMYIIYIFVYYIIYILLYIYHIYIIINIIYILCILFCHDAILALFLQKVHASEVERKPGETENKCPLTLPIHISWGCPMARKIRNLRHTYSIWETNIYVD